MLYQAEKLQLKHFSSISSILLILKSPASKLLRHFFHSYQKSVLSLFIYSVLSSTFSLLAGFFLSLTLSSLFSQPLPKSIPFYEYLISLSIPLQVLSFFVSLLFKFAVSLLFLRGVTNLQLHFVQFLRSHLINVLLSRNIEYFKSDQARDLFYLQNTIVNRCLPLLSLLFSSLQSLLVGSVYFLTLFLLAPSYPILLTIFFLLFTLLTRSFAKSATNLSVKSASLSRSLSSDLLDIYRCIKMIKQENLVTYVSDKYIKVSYSLESTNQRLQYNSQFLAQLTELCGYLFIGCLVTTSIVFALPNVGIVSVASLGSLAYLSKASNSRLRLKEMLSYMNLIANERVLPESPQLPVSDQPILKDILVSSLHLNQVSKSYSNETCLLGLTLTLQGPKSYALIGPSGSGKSTLLDIISGIQNQYDGSIQVNNIPYSALHPTQIRSIVGYVTQDIILTPGTIRDFLNFNSSSQPFTDTELNSVLQVACLSDFIQASHSGLSSPLGDNGLLLSGGQRQRLFLARALLNIKPIMLFDEITSSLDSATARDVISNVRQYCASSLCIFSIHDPSLQSLFQQKIYL